jgi:large subunit ribosomal protein L25
MVDDLVLQLEARTLSGKKVRTLRREGVVPANVYGRGRESVAVQASLVEFRRIFRAVDRNAVVDAQIAGESDVRPVVLRNVQRHPVSHEVQHVDLYHIDLKRTIQSLVSIIVIGAETNEAIKLGGVLVHGLEAVMLEALPMDMPSELTIDISHIEHFGESIHVSDLDLPPRVRAVTDAATQLATVIAPRLVEEDAAADAAVEAQEGVPAAEAEAATGDGPAEGSDDS